MEPQQIAPNANFETNRMSYLQKQKDELPTEAIGWAATYRSRKAIIHNKGGHNVYEKGLTVANLCRDL